jgi:hypothetical protein
MYFAFLFDWSNVKAVGFWLISAFGSVGLLDPVHICCVPRVCLGRPRHALGVALRDSQTHTPQFAEDLALAVAPSSISMPHLAECSP